MKLKEYQERALKETKVFLEQLAKRIARILPASQLAERR